MFTSFLLLVENTYLPKVLENNVPSGAISNGPIWIRRTVPPTTHAIRVISREVSFAARWAVPQGKMQGHVYMFLTEFVHMRGHLVGELADLLLLSGDPHCELNVVFELLDFEGELHGDVFLVAMGVG